MERDDRKFESLSGMDSVAAKKKAEKRDISPKKYIGIPDPSCNSRKNVLNYTCITINMLQILRKTGNFVAAPCQRSEVLLL